MPPDEKAGKSKRRKRSSMAQTSLPQTMEVPAPPRRGRTPGSRKEDWIATQLRRVYDEALHEEIPQSMIDLLNALDESGDEK
jgi:hypothetical protein